MWPLLITATVIAQQPQFEGVSIKSAPTDARGGGYNISPGRITAKNQTLRDLVKFAYNLQDYQVAGGPDNETYQIQATYPATTTPTQRRTMMQSLLTSRFALETHRESKEINGYELIPGKKGPKLKNVEPGEQNMMMGRNAAGLRTLHATSAGANDLASLLASITRRPVENHTELTGVFNFDLEWSPDDTQVPTPSKRATEEPPAPVDGPSLFNALQDNLGLTLKSQKVRVEVVVIDRFSKPSEN